ncbi:hypothetical protein V7S57_12220 [Caulobacter sp. CCNWLY153]|nr:hypothetical protein [Caulobacter radicis]
MKTKFSTVALLLAESLLLTPADAEATPRYRRRDGWLSCLSAACWTLTLGTFSFYLAGGMDIAAKMPDIGPVDGKLIATGFTTMVSWVMLVGVIVLRWGSDHVARQINRWAKWPRVEPAPFGYYLVDSCAAFCWVGIGLITLAMLAGVSAQPFWGWLGSDAPSAVAAFWIFAIAVVLFHFRRSDMRKRFDQQVYGGHWNAVRSALIVQGLPCALGASWIISLR